MGVGLAVVRQYSEVTGSGYAKPGALFRALEIAGGKDVLVFVGGGVPPVGTAGWTQDELVAIVEDEKGVGGVGSGYQDNTHVARLCVCSSLTTVCELRG